MNLYRLLLLCKFLGVAGHAGGLAGSFLASAPEERRGALMVYRPTWAQVLP